MRVPNRFGGMRDLAFFRSDIRDLSWKEGWEAGISVASGSGISCFYRVEMRDWQGKQSGIRDFSSSVTSSEIDVTNAKPEAGENEPRLCLVSILNSWPSNDSVLCQVLSSVSIIAYPSLVTTFAHFRAEFYQPAGLCVEFDHVVYVWDARTSCIKVFTTLTETATFLDAVGKIYCITHKCNKNHKCNTNHKCNKNWP